MNNNLKDNKGKNDMELLTVREAAELLKCAPNTIRNYFDEGYLTPVKENVTKVSKAELVAFKKKMAVGNLFGDLVLDHDESLKPLDTFNNIRGTYYNPIKRRGSQKYFVSSHGRVFNLDRNAEIKPQTVAHGYQEITISNNGNPIQIMLHRLVAFVWCDNRLGKAQVHHVDNDPTNNHASNLLWVSQDEQTMLHRILKENGNNNEYFEEIEKIRQDNKCTENLYVILEAQNEYGYVFLTVTERAYKAFKENGNLDGLSSTDIKYEYHLREEDV